MQDIPELNQLKKWYNKTALQMHDVLEKLTAELLESREAAKLLAKMVQGKKLTLDEKKQFEQQLTDLIKGMGLTVVFLAPGGAILTAALVKYASSRHINILPSAFTPKPPPDKPDTP